ncbi:MAG: hypothetical protein GY854_19905 [Deltaproteobacteria bacterium]|nr:hypothetical protein [Deltaproteobacteria bacterium]
MAKPTGGVTAENYTLHVGNDDTEVFSYFVYRRSYMPKDWNSETPAKGNRCRKIETSWEIRVDGAHITFVTWRLDGDVTHEETRSNLNIAAYAWQTELAHIYYHRGFYYNSYPASSYAPRYMIAEMSVQNATDSFNGGRVSNVYFEEIDDDGTYSGAAEMTERASDRLYDPDYPCSSWLIMDVLCETLRKALRENKASFCVPCLGYLVGSPPPP